MIEGFFLPWRRLKHRNAIQLVGTDCIKKQPGFLPLPILPLPNTIDLKTKDRLLY